jgi:hypothetical protein
MTGTNAPIIRDNEKLGSMKVNGTDFDSMTRGAQIRQLEIESYLVIPNELDQD